MNNYNRSYGHNGSYSTSYQMNGRELLDASEVRMLDNANAILFIRGEKAVKDLKFDIMKHPNIALTEDGGAEPFSHGEASEAIADIVIEEWLDETDKETEEPAETGYELLSDADLLKEIEKEENENEKENTDTGNGEA